MGGTRNPAALCSFASWRMMPDFISTSCDIKPFDPQVSSVNVFGELGVGSTRDPAALFSFASWLAGVPRS